MIKYLGSKRVLVPRLVEAVTALPGVKTFFDVFSGTSRVGHAMKTAGLEVTANDHNAYAHVIAQCYVAADRDKVLGRAERLLGELAVVPPREGYVTETFCRQSRFFHPKNGARIDAIRDRIEELDLEPDLRAVALVSLMEAADRVDSTTGVQMAYLKQWAPRAHNDLQLRMPDVLPGPGHALELEAIDAAHAVETDVAYVDPPYNQHSYLRNYHIWETLVAWDAPEHYGVACKRMDSRDDETKSVFNKKREMPEALGGVVGAVDAHVIVLSYNNESWIEFGALVEMMERRGRVRALAFDSKRYVGAQIGIHNPRGERVGEVSHLRNLEYVVVAGEVDLVDRMVEPFSDHLVPTA